MRKIKLTQGQYALVDDEDYDRLSKYKWYITAKRGYAVRRIGYDGPLVYMHISVWHHYNGRFPKDRMLDHKNTNTLDNRMKNLRLATQGQNLMNRGKQKNNKSGYKGVNWS